MHQLSQQVIDLFIIRQLLFQLIAYYSVIDLVNRVHNKVEEL